MKVINYVGKEMSTANLMEELSGFNLVVVCIFTVSDKVKDRERVYRSG